MRVIARLVVLAMTIIGIPAIPALAAAVSPPAAPGGSELVSVIVTLDGRGGLPEEAATRAAEVVDGTVGYVYRHALKGFSMELPAAAIPALERRPGVVSVERDVEVRIDAQTLPTGVDRVEGDLNPGAANFSGVDIAVLDSGVWFDVTPNGAVSHEDLRLTKVSDCTGAVFYPLFGGCQGGGNDDNGHGTHVAGILGACDNDIGSLGTAPCATIWSIKIIGANGSGSGGALLAGVDLVTANADEIEVANMSFTLSGPLAAFETAVGNAIDAGVVMVAAAGNDSMDAANVPPANIPGVITVSAITDYNGAPGGGAMPTCRTAPDDTFADYSNYGEVVDIAAPGSCIYSTYLDNGYTTFSGTSMAAPAVAGAAARYIAETGVTPQDAAGVSAVRDALVAGGIAQSSACGFSGDPDETAEPLLYLDGSAFNGSDACGDGEPPANQPPVASFMSSCSDLTCDFDASGSTDEDPATLSYAWDFGDGTTGTGIAPSHAYANGGSYQVTLTVTDNDGLTDTTTQTVTPTEPPPGDLTMTVGVAGFLVEGRYATVEFYVIDENLNGVPGANVVGEWTFITGKGQTKTREVRSTSDENGLVSITTRFSRGATVTQFCVTNVTKPGYTYEPGLFSCGGPL
jgi:PKD repeat protein